MRYYNKTLNLDALKENGKLEVLDVKNKNIIDKNSAYDEAKEIVEYIKRNKLEKVSIITPFVNQNKLITSMLKKEGIEGVKCGTIHSIQGAENSTIIFSLAISLKSSQRTYDWIKNNHELINVAVTRAQNKLVIAGDMEAVNLKSDKKDDLYNLCEYVRNNGKIVIPQSETIKIEIGKSNGSKYEDEFYKTISQFCSTHKKYEVTRNTLMTNIFPDIEEIKNTKYEFDCVIYEKTGFGDKPYAVFEVNGGEHLGTIDREKSDALKQRICRQKEVKIIFIPNELVKAYEYIREVLCEAKDDSFQQLSLFDYFNE